MIDILCSPFRYDNEPVHHSIKRTIGASLILLASSTVPERYGINIAFSKNASDVIGHQLRRCIGFQADIRDSASNPVTLDLE